MTDTEPLTSTGGIARAYLPENTRLFTAIMNAETAANRVMEGAARYVRGAADDTPAGATNTAWDLYTAEAIALYRRRGAIVTIY